MPRRHPSRKRPRVEEKEKEQDMSTAAPLERVLERSSRGAAELRALDRAELAAPLGGLEAPT